MTGMAELKQREHAERSIAQASATPRSISHATPLPARIVVPIRPDLAMNETALESLREFAARYTLFLLRLSLATILFWFGVLKVANVSPVVELLRSSIPFLARSPYLQLLG